VHDRFVVKLMNRGFVTSGNEMGLIFDLKTVGERYSLGCVCRKVSEVKNFETGRSAFSSANDGEGLGYMEVDDEGGTSSSRNVRAKTRLMSDLW
jgi:hypothetical protein